MFAKKPKLVESGNIVLHGLTKSYLKTRPVLNHVELLVRKGEFLFLTGVSGSGKTTVLRLIHALEIPDDGQLFVLGRNLRSKLTNVLRLRREIGFIYQDYKLLENCTVRENIELPLLITGKKAAFIQKRVDEISKHCMIDHLLDQKTFSLSGGEKQLTAIARAAIDTPKIILADEPTANLDRVMTLKILNLLMGFNKLNTTVIVATHDIELIKSYKTRLVIIKDAKISDFNY